MFNPFGKNDHPSKKQQVLEAGYHGFIVGLAAGIQMVRIAADRDQGNEYLGLTLSHVADVMQQTLDEFQENHCDKSK